MEHIAILPGTTIMRWIAVLLISIAIALAILGVELCEKSIHVPRRIPRATPAAYLGRSDFTAKDVQVSASDGAVLKGWFLTPPSAAGKCVAILHGIADSRIGAVGLAPMFLDHGYSVLIPDSRAHGESGGSAVTYGLIEGGDANRWAAWMREQGCRSVFGLGESLGGAILLEAAGAGTAFDAIASECTYSSFTAIALERVERAVPLPKWASPVLTYPVIGTGLAWARIRNGIALWQVDPAAAARRSKIPILLIHGLDDGRTSPENSRRIAAGSPRVQLWLVPGADHVRASSVDPRGFEDRVFGFFDRNGAAKLAMSVK